MIKDIQVTLYEIFGYLFPGTIVCFAFAVFWSAVFPDRAFDFTFDFSKTTTIFLLFLAYLTGHIVQSIGNLLERLPFIKHIQSERAIIGPEMSSMVRAAISRRFGKPQNELSIGEIYALCDQALIYDGSLGEREILTYREGFYRGCSVSLIFLSLAFFVTIFTDSNKIFSVAITLLSVVSIWLTFERYKRFYAYRFKACLFRFLALSTASVGKHKEKTASDER